LIRRRYGWVDKKVDIPAISIGSYRSMLIQDWFNLEMIIWSLCLCSSDFEIQDFFLEHSRGEEGIMATVDNMATPIISVIRWRILIIAYEVIRLVARRFFSDANT
jgi:hypothetical protein